MKKVLALVAAAGILSVASFASAATIVGSKHDMNAAYAGGVIGGAGAAAASGTTQVCVYCHAPHVSQMAMPLWNRNNPSGFTLYSGLNMANVSFKSGFTADSTSLFCMSCHDGNMNINAVYNQGANVRNSGASLVTGTITGTYTNLGKNLSNTHPVNFPVLNNSQADLNYVASNTYMGPIAAQAVTAGAPNITTTFPLFKATRSGVTTNQSLECGSCHSVHDFTISPFLRATMNKSALCLGCHNK